MTPTTTRKPSGTTPRNANGTIKAKPRAAKATPAAKATKAPAKATKAPAKATAPKATAVAPVAPASTPAGGVRLLHDGRPMPDSQNKVSSVAYYYTKGLGSDGGRLSTEALRALIVEAGGDPAGAGWTVTLPNGVVLSAVTDDQVTATPGRSSRPTSSTSRETAKQRSDRVTAELAAAKAAKATAPARSDVIDTTATIAAAS